jgi:hypothetical protein
MQNSVFMLNHNYGLIGQASTRKLIGVYPTRQDANIASLRLIQRPGFRDHPHDFVIEEYLIDQDHITLGFTYT